MTKAMAAARAGFRRFFSISAFTPPPPANVPPPAEPSPNLFVSGLSKRTTSEGLREAFSKFGNLVHARVVTDRISGYSKGFGFVRYATTEEAVEGIKGMDGKFLDGWVIFAEYAKPRPPPQGQSQSPQYTNSAPPSSSTSQMSQSWSSYRSPPTSETQPGYSSYEPRESQPPSNCSPNAPETPPPPPSYSSAPPSNYSSETPSSFASVRATNYAWGPSSPPNYAPSSLEASQPANASVHGTSEPSSRHALNNSSRNSEMQSENQIFETFK